MTWLPPSLRGNTDVVTEETSTSDENWLPSSLKNKSEAPIIQPKKPWQMSEKQKLQNVEMLKKAGYTDFGQNTEVKTFNDIIASLPKTLNLSEQRKNEIKKTLPEKPQFTTPEIPTIKNELLDIVSPTRQGLADIILRPKEAEQATKREQELSMKSYNKQSSPQEEQELAQKRFTGALGLIGGGMETPLAKKGAQIIGKEADIALTKPMIIKDVTGQKITLPVDTYTPHKLSSGNVILKDGVQHTIPKNQYLNVKNQAQEVGKEFAPELKQVEENIKQDVPYNAFVNKLKEKYDPTGRLNMSDIYPQLSREDKISFDEIKKQKQFPKETTKFSQYTLPGGENYREVLIKSPMPEISKELPTGFKVVKNPNGYGVVNPAGAYIAESGSTPEKAILAYNKRYNYKPNTFTSPHWDEPNVLSHLRMNDRVTPDGKKVLHLEELQSDWANAGRKKGYINPERDKKVEEYTQLANEFTKQYGRDWWGQTDQLDQTKFKKWSALVKEVADIPESKIPNHPLLKNWQELSLKRALKEAVDGGYDYLSWVSGKQTADRYNLAKYVDGIEWRGVETRGTDTLSDKKFDLNILSKNGNLTAEFDKNGNILQGSSGVDWKGKNLADVIGKDVAEKILSKPEGALNTKDLTVGGEWANNLYDRQVPNLLKDMTGQKAEGINIQGNKLIIGESGKKIGQVVGNDRFQQSIKITPEIRAMVKGEIKKPSGAVPTSFGKTVEMGAGFNPINELNKFLKNKTPNIKSEIGERSINEGLSSFSESRPTNAVDRIVQALKEAKPIRGQQKSLYSEELAKRTARIVAMGKNIPGQKGFYAQLGQLKGELPKVEFESIKNKITQSDVDSLFQTIENHTILSPFEKINAKRGLEKLVGAKGGSVPTKGEISLLSEVFPPEFIAATMEKRPLMEKLWHGVGEVLNLPRAMMATADLSAPLRQGIFLVGRPKQWIPAFRDMFKYAFSEKAYQGLAQDIKARPTYKLMRESKLALTDIGENMTKREEAFMSNLSEKIPVFGHLARGSNRAYSGFLNKLRADTFDSMVNSAKQTGILKERPEVINDIAKFVNSATGRGELGGLDRAAVALNGVFFSPRLMASRMNLLNPVYYVKLDPFVRKEALKSLFTFAGTAGTILGLAKLGGANIGVDPRSADFAKIKIGNTRFDILGGFQQYMVLISRLATGQMVSSTTGKQFNLGEGYKPTTKMDIAQRFFESKTSPVGSFILGLARGKTSGGDDFDLPVEITNRFIPMVTQDMYDLYRERGLQGIGMSIPGIFGTGIQTYSDQIPLESRTPTGKPTIKWMQTPGLAEKIVNKVRGTQVVPVPVKATYDKVQELDAQGKGQEAQQIVDSLSDNDYELYKKFMQRDRRIKTDEIKIKIEPIYKNIRQLDDQGKTIEAQKILDSLNEDEYKAYQWFLEKDYKRIG